MMEMMRLVIAVSINHTNIYKIIALATGVLYNIFVAYDY
jgi:hypothetical protein